MIPDYTYLPQVVEQLRSFYDWNELFVLQAKELSIYAHLDHLAQCLYKGLTEHNYRFLYQEVNNYHPDHLGRPIADIYKLYH